MRVTVSAATFLAWVSVALAQTPGFDAILTPAKDEVLTAGSTYTIKWDYSPSYAGSVSIVLLQGPTPTTLQVGPVIGSSDNAAGQYSWTVDSTLGNDATYGLKIVYSKNEATFQYSNPFHISKAAAAATSVAASSSAIEATTRAAAATTAASAPADDPSSVVYSTEWLTITSCAATVTNCPARSTVTSSTVKPLVTTVKPVASTDAVSVPVAAPSSAAPVTSEPAQASSATTASVTQPKTTLAPVYPVGNSTGKGNAVGTATLPSSAVPTSSVVTAGAGRVAAGSVALFAGLVAAVFAL